MKKNLIGSVVRIPMDDKYFCYARLLGGIDNVIYDYKGKIEEEDILKIVQSDILFAVLTSDLAREVAGCKIIGKIPLDERHKIIPIYFHPDMTNDAIIDYTIEKLKQTMQYKTFEKRGLQDGGIHSVLHIQQRLKSYYDGKDNQSILNLLKMLDNLRVHSLKK